ncbi:two-component system sensor histidine kinase NtrB [Frateuria aurantia]
MTAALWPQWMEQMSTGLAMLDARLRLCWVNTAFAEMFEVGPRSVLGLPLSALLIDERVLQQVQRAQREKRSAQLWGAALPSSRGHWRSADMALQCGPEGAVYLEVHLLHDAVAEPAPLSATLRGFAHEVKNPLAGLRGAAQLLARRVQDDELRELAGLVIDEADRLAGLANRLLYHDAGAVQLGPVNIHHVLERLKGLMLAQDPLLQIRYDFDPSLPDTYGDADRLLQVVLNLAHNAVNAGARRLILRSRMEHVVRIGERQLRGCLRIDMIDDGPGVPDALRYSLFEPLVSGEATGTGLGLALCREIAHEHGGELRYLSRPGETTFSLYLPKVRLHDDLAAESLA